MSTTSIPAFHVSDISKASGGGEIFIQSRKDAASAGTFKIKLDVHFDPAVDLYPGGTVIITTNLSDSAKGTFKSTSIELINSYGKHNPTVYLTGRCDDEVKPDVKGCRFWLMIANNKERNVAGTPDIVGFAIHDNNGNRIAYGTGPLKGDTADIIVTPK